MHPSLADLEFLPYIDNDGELPQDVQGKIGVYAIFDQAKTLQCIAYSRDIYVSLLQHLVRQIDHCHWVKVYTIDRPNRSSLETTRDAWIAEYGSIPPGNGSEQGAWHDPIDAKGTMTETDQSQYDKAIDDVTQVKLRKAIANRLEATILDRLRARGLTLSVRFNPKLKDQGLLDLK